MEEGWGVWTGAGREGGVGVKRGEDEGEGDLKATGTSSPSSPFVGGFDEGAVATLSLWGRGAEIGRASCRERVSFVV